MLAHVNYGKLQFCFLGQFFFFFFTYAQHFLHAAQTLAQISLLSQGEGIF